MKTKLFFLLNLISAVSFASTLPDNRELDAWNKLMFIVVSNPEVRAKLFESQKEMTLQQQSQLQSYAKIWQDVENSCSLNEPLD